MISFGIAALLGLHAGPAHASVNLVQNGDFELASKQGSYQINSSDYTDGPVVTGWTTTGYNFIFTSGTADSTGATGQYGSLYLWGPGNGSANGLPATSPSGGNYIAADGAYNVGAISQTISGLTPGEAVAVSFWWAGAQQYGYDGDTTEQWRVSLGGDTQYTPVVDNASHGFTGWMKETFVFIATQTTEVLSFLALGTPEGVPPFSLLDGVTVTAVPEPAGWTVLLAGAVGIAGVAGRRKRTVSARRSAANS